MDIEDIKLTSSEIGALWLTYIQETMADCVNKYMLSIIEDNSIRKIFEDAINKSANHKEQITGFLQKEGFPIPVGFTDSDFKTDTARLFSDIFCLHYLHIMTIHGLQGHIATLSVAVRRDLRQLFDSFDNDAKSLYHQTTNLLLEKGKFQRDPYFYPTDNIEFVDSNDFIQGVFKTKRKIAATEMMTLSFNIKKAIMAKALSIAFSQVTQIEEARKFFIESEDTTDKQIQTLSKILQDDHLPSPTSWESEITTSTQAPFSEKLMLYHIGYLFQAGQVYHGTGLASATRADLVIIYEKIILKNLSISKNWFDIMTKFKWLEQPPLAPDRKDLAQVNIKT